jgi:hypothetical protein
MKPSPVDYRIMTAVDVPRRTIIGYAEVLPGDTVLA